MSEQEPASGRTADGNAAGPEAGSQVEVAHEALIQKWPRLRGWLESDRTGLRLRQEVGDAARAWEEHGRTDAFVTHDETPRFEAVDALSSEKSLPLSVLERAYVEACRAARARRAAEVAENARQRERTVALRSQVHAAAGAMGSGLGYGAAFGVAYWREVQQDWWEAQLYAAAWFPLGVVFGLAVEIALQRFPRPPTRRIAAAGAVGGLAAGAVYALARRWTAVEDSSFGPEQLAAGALTGATLGLGVAVSFGRWGRLMATIVLGVLGLAAAVALDNWQWELTTVVLAGLLLGGLTGAGFLIIDTEAIDIEAAAQPPIDSTTRNRAMPWRPRTRAT